MTDHIYNQESKKEEAFLRKKTAPFDFKDFSKKEIEAMIRVMRQLMRRANGIGLSANQAGIPLRFFIAEVPATHGDFRFYAVFNPELEKISEETDLLEEGCLSVPGVFGEIVRARRVTLRGFDQNGKPLKIKAWGLLAQVFQHEVGHLNGELFVDKAKKLYTIPVSDRLVEKEKKKASDKTQS